MSNVPGRRRVAVTGVGLVNPFGGMDAQDFFARLMQGESAIRLYRHPSAPETLKQPAGVCQGFDPDAVLGPPLAALMDRYSQLGVAAGFAAWDDAGLARKDAGSDEYGVSWGTGIGGAMTVEKGYTDFFLHKKDRAHPLSVVQVMNNAAASLLAINLGLGSACLTYSVACASSAIAIGEAMRRIQSGESQLIIAGGSEAPLSSSIMRAWEAMRVVAMGNEETAPHACRPFQEGRAGLVLGEGAAALVLEDWEHATARGARIYCELAGYGQSCDHTHLVKPDAYGQTRAMTLALREAGLAPEEVGYVNAHGTATREGDPSEIEALRQVFGEHAGQLLVSASKSMHGHLLGATGAMEALITVLALARGEVPPTAHLDTVAEDCRGVQHVMGEGLRNVPLRAAVSNSFAFGGSNAVLAFRAAS